MVSFFGSKLLVVFCVASFYVATFSALELNTRRHIVLQSGTLDTAVSSPSVHSDIKEDVDYQWLIHVAESFAVNDKVAINEAISPYYLGVYMPHNTYLLVAPQSVANKVASMSHLVLWVGGFLPENKLSPALEDHISKAKGSSSLVVMLPPEPKEIPKRLKRTEEQVTKIAQRWSSEFRFPGATVSMSTVGTTKIVVQVRPFSQTYNVALWIARQPESHWIELARPQPFHNNNAGPVVISNADTNSPIYQYIHNNIDGSSQIIAVADSGLDWNSCYFGPGVPTDNTTLEGKIIRYAVATGGDRSDFDGHGTFVCGTIAGNTTNSVTDSQYNGIAPGAQLYFWDISIGGAPYGDPTNFRFEVLDYFDSTLIDQNRDLNIWLFTFGAAATGGYSTFTQDIDSYLSDNPFFTIVVPSGNEDESHSALTEAALSKNAIVVGASQSVKSTIAPPPGDTQPLSDTLYGTHALASFSAKGPTPDGRIKPDVVAPGQRITSASHGKTCGTEIREGTSYAAAVATGAAALVGDYFAKSFYPGGSPGSDPAQNTVPSSALIKAMVINSAQSLRVGDAGNGNYVSLLNHWPSGYQGFGRIELDQALWFNGTSPFNMTALDTDVPALNTGETYRACFQVNNNFRSLKLTLVWIDPAGTPASGVLLVNDLDLVVMDHAGNVYKTMTAHGEYDSTNNVEQIYLTDLPNGNYSFLVYGSKVVSSGGQRWAMVGTGSVDFTLECTGNFDNSTAPICPNGCSGHGACTATASGFGSFLSSCVCDPGYSGVDCSKVPCPSNCSGNGICDYLTSTCLCNLDYDPATYCSTPLPTVQEPQAPPANVVTLTDDNLAGKYAGVGVGAFVFGALVFGIIGFFGALKYLEHKRDAAASQRVN